jgi:hypothetical protein
MSAEELCARSIGSFYSIAHRVANDRTLLLNYAQLSLAEISNVLNFFGVRPAATEMETIVRQSQTYAKAVSGERVFIADAAAKQQVATDLVRNVAHEWASEPYQLLEQRSREAK